MDQTNTGAADALLASWDRPPVLAVRLGRGRTGGTLMLDWLIQRARTQGRDVLAADGDRAREACLSSLHPSAMRPASDDLADVKEWMSRVLSTMATTGQSVALDLGGGGERVLAEYGRDLGMVEFCHEAGAQPLALFCMGPDAADFEHALAIARAGYFRPERCLLILNEHLVPGGRSPAGAFAPLTARADFAELVAAGMRPVLLPSLPCMAQVRALGLGFYEAAAGKAPTGGECLDPVRRFMAKRWLATLEDEVAKAGATAWLP